DLRFAFRSLSKRPGFTVVAVLTLMLAIGVNTTIFSVVNAVLLRALPFRDPEQLIALQASATDNGLPGIAGYQYLSWREKQTSFADLGAYTDSNFNLTGLGEPERISGSQVTASVFTTLGVQPVKGRLFLPQEDAVGANNVAIVSEKFWRARYGGEDSILGSSLTLDNKPYTIVGVMPAGFRFPGEFDVWVPLALDPAREFGDFFSLIEVVGRIKPSESFERAQTELSLIARNASEQGKEQGKEPLPLALVQVVPLHQQLVAGARLTVLVLWGAVGLVMLIACVNVAGLVVSRTLARQREMAVRAAVGARRWQLVRQLLTESIVLGLAGGVLGLLIAFWSTRAIGSLVPADFATTVYDLGNIPIDWRVFAFTLTLSVVTGVVFGLAPALAASKPDLIQALRNSRSAGLMSFGLGSFRGWLVISELALAMVLLVAAGLLVRSFNKLNAIDLGFDRENVLTARIALPRSKYKERSQVLAFQQQLLQNVKALPGVQAAGAINHTPLNGFGIIVFTAIEGQPPPDKNDPPIGVGSVSPDYFQTLKIPLLSGRYLDERDGPDKQKVALVNQAFAQRFFPNGDVVGKRLTFACEEAAGMCRTIVGVVGNIRQESLTDNVATEFYIPSAQMPTNGMTVFVRTTSDPLSLVGAVRSQVLAVDKDQPMFDVKTLAQRVSDATAVSRSLTILFAAFAVLALVLGMVGVYGIVSYSVTQRTQEIGIRMALGARALDILQLILRHGFVLVLSGVALGVAGALALTRFLTTLLFGITPTDRFTFVVVAAIFFVTAMVAALIPARRATKVDPLTALRYE
ncbi:MAG TPA: ABC transporter permease, partial [Pyrinomonadaceae bacterium]|nr:ABC transporter permease [Pyrinomonadaceae bacterium]